MNKRLWAIAVAAITSAVILYGCSKGTDDNGGGANTDPNKDFKTRMLTNYADNILIPAYSSLKDQLDLLDASINTFLTTPSDASRLPLKTIFKNAYISYEGISAAYFGPAASLLINNYINTFPCVPGKIETGIQTGIYNFAQPVASDSIQGFPALDYLLFSAGAVQKFSDAGSANRKKYVQDIMARMKSLVSEVLSQWNGSYRSTFINSTKTNVGSSIGYLINQFAFEMDALKGPRIGWPFGKKSNGTVFADKCEGYYSGITAALAIANLTSLKNYYAGGNGDGIADYLALLQRNELNNEVLAQFDIALDALEDIPDPMSDAFTNNPALVENAYKEVQKLLTLIKTDVASATAVQVTYMDNDGD